MNEKRRPSDLAGGRDWLPQQASPLVDIVVSRDVPSSLLNLLLVGTNSVPAEFHFAALDEERARPRIAVGYVDGDVVINDPRTQLRIRWDGTRQTFNDITAALTSLARRATARVLEREVTLVGLAMIDALTSVQSRRTGSPSSYMLSAHDNIKNGDAASVRPNLSVGFRELDRVAPDWWLREDGQRLKVALRSRLAGALEEQIGVACEILADELRRRHVDTTPGEIRQHWSQDELP